MRANAGKNYVQRPRVRAWSNVDPSPVVGVGVEPVDIERVVGAVRQEVTFKKSTCTE